MKNLIISYFLCAAGLFTPLAGLHRFYLEKSVSGIVFLFNVGLLSMNTIYISRCLIELIQMFLPLKISLHRLRAPS
jgi:TM2 domain-containing membrane protein YozV